jgi:hypothetical protein
MARTLEIVDGATCMASCLKLLWPRAKQLTCIHLLTLLHVIPPLQVDPCVAYHLWVLVFPIVWATLQKQQQINLAKPIISLLSKEYHQRQAMARPNVVQARTRLGFLNPLMQHRKIMQLV